MSKISDNVSDGSQEAAHPLGTKKKGSHIDKFRHTKQGPLGGNSSVGGISDIKIEGGKTQTFHTDLEEYSTAGGGTVPMIGGQ